MTFPQFQAEMLKAKRIDTDGVPKGEVYQCVDLIKEYLKRCFDTAPGSFGNAINYWNNTAPVILTKFIKISSTAVNQGDIVVLEATATNSAGHIGIATGNTTDTTVEILEQNGSTGKGQGTDGDAIRTRFIDKTRIAGLLRPKEVNMPTLTNSSDLDFLYPVYLGRTRGNGEGEDVYLNKDYKFVSTDLFNSRESKTYRANQAALPGQVKDLAIQVQSLTIQITALNKTVTDLQNQLKAKIDELAQANADNVELNKQLEALGQSNTTDEPITSVPKIVPDPTDLQKFYKFWQLVVATIKRLFGINKRS